MGVMPARGQLKAANCCSLFLLAPEILVSRDSFSYPVLRQPGHSRPHDQAKTGAYSQVPLVHPTFRDGVTTTLSNAIESVPSYQV